MKTYSKRTNAKRAAIAAGIPANEVEIVPVKEAGKAARFTFKRKGHLDERNGPIDEQEADGKGTSAARSKAKGAVPVKAAKRPVRAQCEQRNGVKRPRPGGLCAAVWQWLDQHPDAKLADVRAAANKKSWNQNNASIEFYGWRKFNAVGNEVRKAA